MRKMSKFLAVHLLLALFAFQFCQAQNSIHGSVVDENRQPLSGASVLLLNATDSSLVKGSVTAKNGSFLFEQVHAGTYLIASSYVGYKDVYSAVFQFSSNGTASIPALQIYEKETALQVVTVSAKKPMFEQKIDRMVINVASSVTNAGSTALEVLMRSPGITVNQQNNTLSMNGKEGVVVMLNGRMSRMPIEALVQMLAGMSSANIEKIELITTPPANFDAEGNAGFINIVLKKNTQYGTNGSFSVTAGYGLRGGPVTGASMNFNHRMERWNIFGDYSFYRMEPSTHGNFYRKVINGSSVIENQMNTVRDDFRRNHNSRLGVDYESGRKTVIGLLVSGFSNMYGMKAVNTSNIFSNGILDTIMRIDNPERHPLENYSVNFNLQHQFKPEQRLTFNIERIHYKDANTLDYFNQFYRSNRSFIYSDKTRSNKETPIRFWVATADYYKRLGKNVDLESGIKTTSSHFINDVSVEREVQNNWITDPDFTSKHTLNETILAAYTSFNFQLGKKTTSKAGLRYEHTTSNLGSETRKNIVDRKYGNLFPSIFVSHTLSEKSSFNFSYSRRITRPTFNEMAPFVYFIDPNTFFAGNAAVQPSTANSVKGDYLWKRAVFSLSYTAEKGTITRFTPQVDAASNKQTLVAENQKSRNMLTANMALPFTITSWWNMQNNIVGNRIRLNALYKGEPLTIKQMNLSFNTTQSFTLPKDFTMELNGMYFSGGMFGIYKIKSFMSLNFGLQKKLGPKAGNLSLNVTDFSGPPRYHFSVDAPEHNLVTNGSLRFVVTTFKLTYTRKFGNMNVKEKRNRTTGAEEEKQRVQTN